MMHKDITHSWVKNNKDILHQYFFDVIDPLYLSGEENDKFRYSGKFSRDMTYSLYKDNNMRVVINFDNGFPDLGYFVIHPDTDVITGYSFCEFLKYMREKKLNELL